VLIIRGLNFGFKFYGYVVYVLYKKSIIFSCCGRLQSFVNSMVVCYIGKGVLERL